MKYLLLLAGSLLFLHPPAGGQYRSGRDSYQQKKFSFSFNVGVGVPLQDFSKGGRPDSTHAVGYANLGFHFEVCMSYLIFKYVGVAATLDNTLCPLNTGEYASAYNVPDSFSVSAQGNHYIACYLIGPYLNLPFNNRFNMEIKALGGIVSAIYPDITILPNDLNNPTMQEFKFAHAQNFGFMLSACGKYMVEQNFAIMATVSYTSSEIVYPGGLFSISTPAILKSQIPRTYTGFSFTNMDMQLGLLSFTMGVALCF